MANKTKIIKWGNSSGIKIPKQLMDKMDFNIGDEIILTREGNRLVISSIPSWLDGLVEEVKKEER